ncbi:hypothetical protein Dcar01_03106 [Deinococcus carri]|uniref:eCIS core domain-containing protein n=1 Tax=Deinococcus carri TaxID=1211323 RepID=A0ABP9WAI6_9DEIO
MFEPKNRKTTQPSPTFARPASVVRLQSPPAVRSLAHEALVLGQHTRRLPERQQQVVQPVFRATELRAAEEARLGEQRASLEHQAAELAQDLPEQALAMAQQRQQDHALPARPPRRPATPAEWVTVMRFQAEQIENRRLTMAESAQFSSLQRQVAQTLARNFREDRQAPQERYAQYAGHLVNLQRHPISGQVAQVALSLMPAGERPSLQRAVAEAQQREEAEQTQDAAALQLYAVQRQLAGLEQEAAQPVSARIQARRGSGTPLPAAVQRQLEAGLNHDLSRVRIHDDAEADELTKGVNAVAFTTGADIYFRRGTFNPNTRSGLELLAHEATHVKQQALGRVGSGVDPDAGLEAEARELGARLANRPAGPRFGTHAGRPGRQPGARTVPSAARLAALSQTTQRSAPAIQRWPNPLKVIQTVKDRAVQAVSGSAQRVKENAQRAVQAAIHQAEAAARPAIQAARQIAAQVKADAGRVTAAVQQRVQGAARGAGTLVTRAATGVRQRVQATTRQVKAGLKNQASALAALTAQTIHRAGHAVSQSGVARLARAASHQAATFDVRGAAAQAAEKVKAAADHLRTRASALGQRARADTQALYEQAKTGIKKAAAAAQQQATRGWGELVKKGRATMSSVARTVRAIKNSPRVQRAAAFLKEAGIQVAKVGTAIVVGGAVIAGAAALTAATGGLAGPALVAALFASGALGGAAGQVVENALRGKKWNKDISAKSLLTDGALGVALGPAAKLVGGLARGVARPVLNVGGKALKALSPAATQAAASLALVARARGAGVAATVARPLTRGRRLTQVAAGRYVRPVLSGAGRRLSQSALGRGFHALDANVSAHLRRLSAWPARAGRVAGKGWKAIKNTVVGGVKGFVNRSPALKALGQRAGQARKWTRGQLEEMRDALAVGGLRVKAGMSRGWQNLRRQTAASELEVRRSLQARGLYVSQGSLTGRVFDAAERTLASMKNYVSHVGHEVAEEVRGQWLGSAGPMGAMRLGREIENTIAVNPALAAGWRKELQRANHGLVSHAARAMRNEAAAAGQTLSRTAARRAASARVTREMAEEYARRTASGRFMSQVVKTHRQLIQPRVTSFEPQQNWLGQLPRVYGTGAKQMWADVRGKGSALNAAYRGGGAAGAASLAGGWLSEEVFKTFVVGTASAYKQGDTLLPSSGQARAGLDKVRGDVGKNAFTAATGLIPEMLGGRLMPLAPFDREVKTLAAIAGYGSTTVTNELGYEPPQEEAAQTNRREEEKR